MYNPADPQIYGIADNDVYKIRCYTIEVNMDSKKDMLCLRSTGELK